MPYVPNRFRKKKRCTKCGKQKEKHLIKQRAMHGKMCDECYTEYRTYWDNKKKDLLYAR